MNTRKTTLVALTTAIAIGASASDVYREDFQKLGDYAPGVVRDLASVTIDNEPCWEQYFALSVHAKRDLLLWEKGIPVAKGDFDFGFEVKNFGAPGYAVVLGKERVAIPADYEKRWGAVQVKARGGKADVYVMKNRVYEKFATVNIPKDLATVNIFAPANSSFAVKNVLSETARNGFQIDTSLKRLYPDFASIARPFDGTACDKPVTVKMPDAPRCGIRLQKNAGAITVLLEAQDKDGKTASTSNNVTFASNETFKDGALVFPGLGTRYVLPHHFAFGSRVEWGDPIPQMADLKREWQTLPNATNHVTDIDFIKTPDGTQVWIDGNYVSTRKLSKPCSFILSGGAKYAMKKAPAQEASDFLTLDLAANPKAKAFAKATLKGVKPGRQTFGKIPVNVVNPLDSQDIALCHQAKGAWALEVEEYFSDNRGPLKGFPGESHFLVPAATYKQVALVFALDPDPGKDAVLTLTFGRYKGEIGGNKLTQTTLDFTKGVPESCKKVGEVALGGKTVPLYYTEVDVDLGKIVDFTTLDYMDFEFTGKLWETFQQDDKSMRPDPSSTSAFNIFGVTLVKSPVKAKPVLAGPANCFTKNQSKKTTSFEVRSAFGTAKGEVSYRIVDENGKVVREGAENYSVSGEGAKTVVADYSDFDTGWYEIFWTVKEGGKTVLTHRGALGVLPADGRKWSQTASPYATWLFMGTHGTPTDCDLAGRLLQMAGVRKASLDQKYSGKYGVIPIGSAYVPSMNELDKPDFEKKLIEGIEKAKKEKPFVDHVMVWHESAPGGEDAYYELLGLPVPPADERAKKRNERVARYVTEIGRIVHKNFPGLRLQIGNSSASMGAVTYPMRGGADPSAYDSIGLESPSQMVPPERYSEVGLLGLFAARDLASKWAKRPVKVNGCYEFIYRSERDIGLELQGEYQARDIIISLAHGFTLVSPGIFFDCSTGYYNGLWGGSGIMERGPWCYPKKAYVAYAVATKVLDDVKYTRSLDTGSSTIYAVEFKRADGKYVTATWAARGEFDFDFAGNAELISLYGGKGAKHGSGRVVYIVSSKPLEGFKVSNRTFPLEDGIFKDAAVVCDISDLDFTVEPDPDVTSVNHGFMPQMKPGAFETRKVEDPERGAAIEVTLKSDPAKTTSYWTEFTTLRFAEPVPVPGEPLALGVEVFGNSNWGQFRFEIEDADGEVFKNISTGSSWGCDIMDWPGRLAVAFDGWSWVGQSLRANDLFPDHSPATYEEQWQSFGGDKKIKYPIKVRALTIGMNRDRTTLFGFEPSVPTIKVKSIRAR